MPTRRQKKQSRSLKRFIGGTKEEELLDAIRSHRVKVATDLIENGADVNAADLTGFTALMSSSYLGLLDVISLLIKKGANVNAHDNNGNTALIMAVNTARISIAKLLIDNGADVNATTNDGTTILIRASERDNIDIIRLLIENGANVNTADQNGKTPLMSASLHRKLGAVELLIENGANVNAADQNGKTALILTSSRAGQVIVFNDYLPIVKVLIEKGADIDAADNEGKTALNYARKSTNVYEYLNELLNKRRKLQIGNLSYVTPLGKRFGLNPNVESTIGSFLSGKNQKSTYVPGQINQIKQNMGVSLAPREGGKKRRKTRKTRHY